MNAGLRIDRLAIALVWLYQGLWCKLLHGERHREVIAAAPGMESLAGLALAGLGVLETLLAAWALSGRRPRAAAWTQTALLVGMNAAGLLWARQHIADPAGMVVMNLAFLALVWTGTRADARPAAVAR